MKKILSIICLALSCAMPFSCQQFMEVEPQGYLPATSHFTSPDDAISAINGLYALMQPLVDPIYLAGEAQGDLVVAGRGADGYIAEIAQNRVTPQNPYTDYTPFYQLIAACNAALQGLGELNRLDPVNYTRDRFHYNRAEILYIRAWTWLQLVKIWGDVPFVEGPLTRADQITDVAPMPKEQILARILKDVEAHYATLLTTKYSPNSGLSNVVLRSQFNNYSARFLLAELYLYTRDYVKAWETIRPVYPYGEAYGQSFDAMQMDLVRADWTLIFTATNTSVLTKSWGQYIDFDGSKGQKNSLMRWANNRNGGIYALRPSTNAIRNWEQTMRAGGRSVDGEREEGGTETFTGKIWPPDGNHRNLGYLSGYKGDLIRGRGVSYEFDGQDTLIFKYLVKDRHIRKDVTQNDKYSNDDALYPIYRDGPMYLMAVEILNNLGMPHQALIYLNGGNLGSAYEIAGVHSTRHRVGVAPLRLDPNGGDPIRQVNRLILEESALESGFEGRRWFDLVRFAERSGDATLLADMVAKKYPAGKRAAIRARLSNPQYWYFPYHQRNVDANQKLDQKTGY